MCDYEHNKVLFSHDIDLSWSIDFVSWIKLISGMRVS
jgi:hypothetical protein